LNWIFLMAALAVVTPRVAHAEALLVVEADTGKVLQADNATMPWYPASVTKIMTAYVTLKAVKDGRLTLDTVLTVSPTAASQSPSKMGFRPGIQVTVDNALKMMMVKSANDMAVVLAEGVGGSIDGFSAMMNQTAQKLGMTQTSYVNPNGLPADGQITSARDLAILARAVIRDLPEYEYFMHIPSIRYGRRVTQNFNKLIGRYPGADGFKTGFICASGYNLVASATRNGKRLIAVVLGASSGNARAVRAAQLLERGFGGGLGWLKPALGTVDNLVPVDATPPNLREEMCSGKRKRPATDEDADVVAANGNASTGENAVTFFTAGLQPPIGKPSDLIAAAPEPSEPIPVYTGPTKTGTALIAAVAADTESQTPAKRGRKSKIAAKKPDAAKSKAEAGAKPAAVRHASAKPEAGAKPAASADKKPAAKPAAADKPAPKPAKPNAAAKPKGENKPAG
jgi:D-alanyl-D-alanine carboxypeptidase